MINVKDKVCLQKGCKIIPIYNNENETIGLYCNKHKLDGMVDVKNKKCIYSNCKKQPTYNKEGAPKGLYCVRHKLEGMIDVINKTCIYPSCKIQPAFNNKNETIGLYCNTHKLDGMIDIKSKTCIHLDCKTRPIYNNKNETIGLYCNTHKLEGMVDVKHKTCKTYLCFTRVTTKYDGYCLYCYRNMFPDKPISRNYKNKEHFVVEYIKSKFPNLNWIADKIINGGCSKRRPDLLLDLDYQIIIVEIDENQHIDYDCSCENKRIMQLSQDLGHRPIIFIRFNPDNYEKDGINITSCWSQNAKGICLVKKSKKNEWEERLKLLEYHINYWITPVNITNKTIEIIQLFYDM